MTDVPIFHITQPLVIWSMPWLLFQVMSNIPKMGQLPTPECGRRAANITATELKLHIAQGPGRQKGGAKSKNQWGAGKTMGKPWENHGKTMGKPWEKVD